MASYPHKHLPTSYLCRAELEVPSAPRLGAVTGWLLTWGLIHVDLALLEQTHPFMDVLGPCLPAWELVCVGTCSRADRVTGTAGVHCVVLSTRETMLVFPVSAMMLALFPDGLASRPTKKTPLYLTANLLKRIT